MAKISTKELFDRYFETLDPVRVKKTRAQIDRPEVYEYERKIGKQLVEMNVDELFDMVMSFRNNSSPGNTSYTVGYNSFYQIASGYRNLFNFYNQITDQIIINPWYDKRLRGKEVTQRIAQQKQPFSYAVIEDTIAKMREHYDEGRADYLECIMLLFYCGFPRAEDIVFLEESMIDMENKTVLLAGRTVQLSDRCFELLQAVHNMSHMIGWRGDFVMASWRGKYFKYNIRPSQIDAFDERPANVVANFINRAIITFVKNEFNPDISYRLLYLCGFYDSLVREYGEDRAQQLILSVRNSDDTDMLLAHAKLYGLDVSNVSQVKRSLLPFVDSTKQ